MEEDVSTVPSSAIEALCACHADIYPNVYILLTIFFTLSESTATSERSFSTMRRLKTRDAGTGLHYGGTAPLTFERGGNGDTGALTFQYHK